jgi:hypothetical protein
MITGAVAGTLLLIGLYFSREVLGLGAALNGRPDPAS